MQRWSQDAGCMLKDDCGEWVKYKDVFDEISDLKQRIEAMEFCNDDDLIYHGRGPYDFWD